MLEALVSKDVGMILRESKNTSGRYIWILNCEHSEQDACITTKDDEVEESYPLLQLNLFSMHHVTRTAPLDLVTGCLLSFHMRRLVRMANYTNPSMGHTCH